MLTRRRFFSESESIHCQPRQKQKRKAWNSGHSFFSHEKSFHDKRKQIFSGMFVKEIVNYHRPYVGTCSITTPLSLLAVSGACHCLAPPCGLQQSHGIGHPLHQGEIVPPVIVTKPVITTRGEGTSNGTTGNQGLPASCWKWRSLWKTQWDANSCHQQEAAGWRSFVEWQKTNAFLHTVMDKLVTAQPLTGNKPMSKPMWLQQQVLTLDGTLCKV